MNLELLAEVATSRCGENPPSTSNSESMEAQYEEGVSHASKNIKRAKSVEMIAKYLSRRTLRNQKKKEAIISQIQQGDLTRTEAPIQLTAKFQPLTAAHFPSKVKRNKPAVVSQLPVAVVQVPYYVTNPASIQSQASASASPLQRVVSNQTPSLGMVQGCTFYPQTIKKDPSEERPVCDSLHNIISPGIPNTPSAASTRSAPVSADHALEARVLVSSIQFEMFFFCAELFLNLCL
ncbi:hypothetical protein [Rhinolophus gammaherpesvirus 1]|uniref:Uncharacterized protein n=1 Tax=Rhinolophus gammaherpesvirus 1 TaxID=2054179 RepID=A0A2Z5U659_9GAMA|nr:hypothetical protein [Rhinolophus gammaherpesvirus 1]BBB06499.1 hypothetical protein [Rhinolophus gammaherpesvirus 1]